MSEPTSLLPDADHLAEPDHAPKPYWLDVAIHSTQTHRRVYFTDVTSRRLWKILMRPYTVVLAEGRDTQNGDEVVGP